MEYLASEACTINEAYADNFEEIEKELVVLLDRIAAVQENLNNASIENRSTIKLEDLKKEPEAISEYEDKGMVVLLRIKQRLAKLRGCNQSALFSNDITLATAIRAN